MEKFYNESVLLFREPGDTRTPRIAFFKDDLHRAKTAGYLTAHNCLTVEAAQPNAPEFSDLEFVEHPVRHDHWTARVEYPNGYSASIVQLNRAGSCSSLFEVAVIHGGVIDELNVYIPGGIVTDLSVPQVELVLWEIMSYPRKEV